jgi:cytosine permease
MIFDAKALFEFESVPVQERREGWSLALTWFGYVAVVVDLLVGGVVGSALPFGRAIAAILTGNAVLMVIAAIGGYFAYKTGRTFALLTSDAFGSRARVPLTLLIAGIAIGWFSIQSSLFAHFIGSQWQVGPETEAVIGVCLAVLMTINAYFGIDGLRLFGVVAVPALALICGWTWLVAPANPPTVEASSTLSFTAAVSMVIGSWIMGATTTVGDIMRFARTKRAAVLGSIFGMSADLGLMILGAAAIRRYGTSDLAEVLRNSAGFVAGVLFFALNVWTTNDNAIYSAGLNVSVATGLKYKRALIACLAIAALVTALRPHRVAIMAEWLTLLGRIVPPIGAVVFVSVWLGGRHASRQLHIASAISLTFGLMAAFLIKGGLGPVNGFIAAAVAQLVLLRVIRKPEPIARI